LPLLPLLRTPYTLQILILVNEIGAAVIEDWLRDVFALGELLFVNEHLIYVYHGAIFLFVMSGVLLNLGAVPNRRWVVERRQRFKNLLAFVIVNRRVALLFNLHLIIIT